MKKAAIYSRKSKFSENGDSIGNQIELCKNYIINYLGIPIQNIIIYEDEGYSGGNVNRPQFIKLINDAEKKLFEYVICYRLDRISRNLIDFLNTKEIFDINEIHFVSIKEQFDTSTPMGNAMLMITSVFAQLERETIAERIRDNMLSLSKTGRWLGGIPPTGYKSIAVPYIDKSGKERKKFALVVEINEAKIVKLLYEKYLELKSLKLLLKFCIENKIKSKNSKDYSIVTLKGILSNTVYCIADKNFYDYLLAENVKVCSPVEEFNSTHGVIIYNKTIQKKGKTNLLRNKNQWIAAISGHKGIILSDDWFKVQELLTKKENYFRQAIASRNFGLLSGLLICGKCKSTMRIVEGRKNKNNEMIFYYRCILKEKSKGFSCNSENLSGNKIDQLIIDKLKASKFLIQNCKNLKALGNPECNIETQKNILRKIIKKVIYNKEELTIYFCTDETVKISLAP